MNPGEYTQPILRTVNASFPLEAGYVGARFEVGASAAAEDDLNNAVTALIENVGTGTVVLKMQETDNHSRSGTRTDATVLYSTTLTTSITLVPGGRTTVVYGFGKVYAEVLGVTGTSNIKLQLSSVRQLAVMAFSKVDAVYDVVGLTAPPGSATDVRTSVTTGFGSAGEAGQTN